MPFINDAEKIGEENELVISKGILYKRNIKTYQYSITNQSIINLDNL